jgi:hypothetical protein
VSLLQRHSPQVLAAMLLLCCLFVTGCNDKPTSIGAELVPGTDTLFATSSTNTELLSASVTVSERQPLYNSTFVLFGKAGDSEGRLFIEFINYPNFGSPDSFTVVSSELLLFPEEYRFGDTTTGSFSLKALELQQVWSAQATWDSIWAADGSTAYYSESQTPVAELSTTIEASDTIVTVPVDLLATKRWLTLGADSATKDQLFGLVLLPAETGAVRQFRNLEDISQKMRLRVVTQHADSTEPDTTLVDAVVACFVNSPDAKADEAIVQGARIHRIALEVRIDSLPEFAIMLGSKLRLTADKNRSTLGTYGLDEAISVRYRSKDGNLLTVLTSGNGEGLYEFPNIVPLLQRIREDGGVGTVEIGPADKYELWRMNRLWFYPTAASDPSLRPFMTLIYTVPTVLQ